MTSRNTRTRQSFRVVINSIDLVSGTNNDGFFKINAVPNIQLDTKVQYQFMIESFATSGILVYTTIVVSIPTLVQKDSYNTTTQTTNPFCIIMASNSMNRTIQHNTIGHQLASIDFLKSSILEVRITDVTSNYIAGMQNWSMSLLFWEVETIDT